MSSVVVTGASSGIGLQISKTLIDKGYRVFGSVRKEEDGARVAGDLGPQFVPLMFDVTDRQAVFAAAEKVDEALAGETLAGLVNNAGIAVLGAIQNLSPEEFQNQFDVNLMGVLNSTQAFLDLLGADRGRTGSPGKIINISSVSGSIGMPFMGAYNMSKFGLEGFSEALRRELMLFGIDVVVIAPGPVSTAIWGKISSANDESRYDNSPYREAFGKAMKFTKELESTGCPPEQIAARALAILTDAKPKTRYVIDASAGQNRLLTWLPKRLSDRLVGGQMGLAKK